MQTRAAHVLIVDNQRSVCRLIAKELSAQGFRCEVATQGETAAKQLADGSFQLLIADIALPGVSGLELVAHARRRLPECKVILMAGAGRRDQLAQALMLGAWDYVEKPIDVDELTGLAGKAVEGESGIPGPPARAAEAMELSAQARQASLDSVRALVRAVEAKDPYTRRHSEQVAHYAVHLARALGLPAEQVERIGISSLLHDVGKIGVPDHILTKPGKLTDEEFEHIRRHSATGAEIVASVTLFSEEAQLIRHHHERWDGNGYPDGLAGEEIPLPSRIINVADSMDAMLMTRSYKPSYRVEKMLGELTRCAGTQFDPRIAAAAVQWCQESPEKLILANPVGSPNRQTAEVAANGP